MVLSSAQTPLLDEDGTGLEAGQWNVRCAWGIYQDSDDYEGQLGPNGISGSYGLNGYFLRIPMDEEYDSGIDAQEGHRNFNAIKQADQVPLFVDALRFDLWPTYRDSPAYYEFESWTKRSDMARCCINRHDGTVCHGFCRRFFSTSGCEGTVDASLAQGFQDQWSLDPGRRDALFRVARVDAWIQGLLIEWPV